LIEGRSLREELRANAARHGQMRCERAVALMRQVCAGVESAHQHGIIHRDLKPDNIMIETEPNGVETVKVLDFGIAKLKENEQTLQSLTDEGMFIGTPNYISPEQCTSLPVDARSDVYSLGVILYEMLMGRVPFSGSNTSTVLIRHLQEPPAPPRRFRSDINEALERTVLCALAKNPSQRPASAAQFSERLDAAVRIENYGEDEPETRERQQLPAIIPFPDRRPAVPIEAMPILRSPTPPPIVRAPQLLLENRSRTGAHIVATVMTLALVGILGYAWQQQQSDTPAALTDSLVANKANDAASRTPTPQPQTANSTANLATRPPLDSGAIRTVSTVGSSSVPASLVRPHSSPAAMPEMAEAQRVVQAMYAAWAMTAARGDWKHHLGFYADRVDYYRDGVIPRGQVEARKRRIFNRLDSFWLRFDDAPQINVRARNGETQAEVVFDKQWMLSRGRQRAEGKSRALLTLRRDAQGWRITGERQLRLYYTRTVKR
jgi:serine/threonine protein kinase